MGEKFFRKKLKNKIQIMKFYLFKTKRTKAQNKWKNVEILQTQFLTF